MLAALTFLVAIGTNAAPMNDFNDAHMNLMVDNLVADGDDNSLYGRQFSQPELHRGSSANSALHFDDDQFKNRRESAFSNGNRRDSVTSVGSGSHAYTPESAAYYDSSNGDGSSYKSLTPMSLN